MIRELDTAEVADVAGGPAWFLIAAGVVAVGALLSVGYCSEHNNDTQKAAEKASD